MLVKTIINFKKAAFSQLFSTWTYYYPKFLPECIHPDYTWSFPTFQPKALARSMPPIPRQSPWLVRRFWGYVHRVLIGFSFRYHDWHDLGHGQIHQLPFGLLIKWSHGTRFEEVAAMKVARAAGLPVPKILSYGEHPKPAHAPISILMTRMPGHEPFEELWEWFNPEQRKTILGEIKACLGALRSWESPPDAKGRICSVLGTGVRSYRVPRYQIRPCENEGEFNAVVLEQAQAQYMKEWKHYEREMAKTKPLLTNPHKIVFTHGDLSRYNMLVTYDGHLSAILDWETAGWYPEYWEYTVAWRFSESGSWWYGIVYDLSDGAYSEELDGHVASFRLICDTLVG